MKLNYANGRKMVEFNILSPINLLPGVSLAWSYYQKVEIYPKYGQQSNYKTPMSLVIKLPKALN